jgi:hypothetical protein
MSLANFALSTRGGDDVSCQGNIRCHKQNLKPSTGSPHRSTPNVAARIRIINGLFAKLAVDCGESLHRTTNP